MDNTLLEVCLATRTLLFLTAVSATLLVLASLRAFFHLEPSPTLPRLGAPPGLLNRKVHAARRNFNKDGHRVVEEAYHRDKDQSYQIQTPTFNRVILPPKYLPELRNLPESILSSSIPRVENLVGEYSGVDILMKGHLQNEVTRGPLTKNLPQLVPVMVEELRRSLPAFLEKRSVGPPSHYTAYALVYTVLSEINSRVFVGKKFCRDAAWVEPVTTYPKDVNVLAAWLFRVPKILRPLVAPFCAAKRRLDRDHARARELLFPPSREKRDLEELTVLNFFLQASKNDDDADTLTSRLLVLTGASVSPNL